MNFTIAITEIGFGSKLHTAVKLVITAPDVTEAQGQGELQICGANRRYNCLIFQLHPLSGYKQMLKK